MTACMNCETDLIPDEIIYCDPCRMSAVFAKLFKEVINNNYNEGSSPWQSQA
jgi:hypothetical protein